MRPDKSYCALDKEPMLGGLHDLERMRFGVNGVRQDLEIARREIEDDQWREELNYTMEHSICEALRYIVQAHDAVEQIKTSYFWVQCAIIEDEGE